MTKQGTFPLSGIILASDPMLNGLGSNGGPTQTMLPKGGSPVKPEPGQAPAEFLPWVRLSTAPEATIARPG